MQDVTSVRIREIALGPLSDFHGPKRGRSALVLSITAC